MHRDDKRCMLLGTQDYNEADGTAIVQAAHIIPESISTNVCVFYVFIPLINDIVTAFPSCRGMRNSINVQS